jgi:hypothetical protein
LKYVVAGIIAGLVSIGIALSLRLSLTVVAIVVDGLAAFIAGVLPTESRSYPHHPIT